jgi:DNA-binding XRE family transcriptional regulator
MDLSTFSMTIYIIFFFIFGVVKKKDLNKKIGLRIIELRMKKGWNQADLGRACGKDRQAIEKLENGRVNPTLYTLFEIAKALEVPLTTLLDFK